MKDKLELYWINFKIMSNQTEINRLQKEKMRLSEMIVVIAESIQPDAIQNYDFLPEWQQQSVADIKKFEEENEVEVLYE